MILRATTVTLGLAAAAVMLSGCVAPAPEPTPTPTAVFASEDEAFAAAEETYRAYVEAANRVDLSDPATFQPMFDWTTGDLSASARKSFSKMHADGWVVDGVTEVPLITLAHVSNDMAEIELYVCQDVSSVTLVDPNGESVVDPNRQDIQALTIALVAQGSSPTGYRIESVNGRSEGPACDG